MQRMKLLAGSRTLIVAAAFVLSIIGLRTDARADSSEYSNILAAAIAAAPTNFTSILGEKLIDKDGTQEYRGSSAFVSLCPGCGNTLTIGHYPARRTGPNEWQLSYGLSLEDPLDDVPGVVQDVLGPGVPPTFTYQGISDRKEDGFKMTWAGPDNVTVTVSTFVLFEKRHLGITVLRILP